jgi:hypothetical protein
LAIRRSKFAAVPVGSLPLFALFFIAAIVNVHRLVLARDLQPVGRTVLRWCAGQSTPGRVPGSPGAVGKNYKLARQDYKSTARDAMRSTQERQQAQALYFDGRSGHVECFFNRFQGTTTWTFRPER